MKQNQQMQKDFSDKVRESRCGPGHNDGTGRLLPHASVLLLQAEEQHGGHATDEEKLASSGGLVPNKDGSCEYETDPGRLIRRVCVDVMMRTLVNHPVKG